MATSKFTIDYIMSLDKVTDKFFCPLSANIYNIKFDAFKIRDLNSGIVLFEIKNDSMTAEEEIKSEDIIDEDEWRTVRYHFGPNFFKLKNIGSTLVFSVGGNPVKNFRMIERHYYKSKLIKSFDFTFPFCIPNSTNEWETMYSLPEISKEIKEDMINNPWETKSDSFYFVDGELIMHNKAEYNYAPFDENDDIE